jgi:hypothetical protein
MWGDYYRGKKVGWPRGGGGRHTGLMTNWEILFVELHYFFVF